MSSISSLAVATLGTPRIGPRRELKLALESFWSGTSDEKALIEAGIGLRTANWARQKKLGVSVIPSNDFSFYDQVLDTSVMVGAIPAIYGWTSGPISLATYFAMARGSQGDVQDNSHGAPRGNAHHGQSLPAQEMTKWFDTNYHYMVPELAKDQQFRLVSRKPIEEYEEAKALGYQTRPVLVGPVTFLKLAKSKDAGFEPLSLLDRLLPVYAEVLRELASRGAEWVQIDEPCLVQDLDEAAQDALRRAYAEIARAVPKIKIMLASYFGGLGQNRDTAFALPVTGLHFDLVRAPEQLDDLARLPADRVVSLGVLDGRNIWRADLSRILDRLEPVVAKLGNDRVQIAPSCSLLHVPIDLALEAKLDAEVKSWLAFSVQKIEELAALSTALASGRRSITKDLEASDAAALARKTSPRIHDAKVASRIAGIDEAMRRRVSRFEKRAEVQHARFNLPDFPTTTIGSFPQTPEIRKARASHAKGDLSDTAYKTFLQNQTARTVRWQESIGLDVLV
ncbi:5-methyltetrahydropteroyltriglutamate--homocysteine S-methyltransferase, partial [Bradyrhizobium sp. UFLA01-814]|uniref:5-methyltetrahydropteroyltriglutamate-- homocysteine S-methyltransferase n=1 Tax=Bradyrhizobium sp. UFLA01-814 TaxID=3023480 RepID=UPI00398B635C